ncbi:MAG: Mut7-C RNAse domain-containing protein [Methanothrix sp.]|nr:Mut7-C RNAse domain-containing protein [Methanothrix sp.]
MQRFLVDLMLMRLGRWLRLLGQDVALPKGESDEKLLLQAKKESRTIITRDKELFHACPGAGVKCVLIRSSAISGQLQEMADAGVPLRLDPRRCTLCNGLLEETEMLGMKRWQCLACKKLYWEGGHWQKMESMLQAIRSRMTPRNQA